MTPHAENEGIKGRNRNEENRKDLRRGSLWEKKLQEEMMRVKGGSLGQIRGIANTETDYWNGHHESVVRAFPRSLDENRLRSLSDSSCSVKQNSPSLCLCNSSQVGAQRPAVGVVITSHDDSHAPLWTRSSVLTRINQTLTFVLPVFYTSLHIKMMCAHENYTCEYVESV